MAMALCAKLLYQMSFTRLGFCTASTLEIWLVNVTSPV